MRRITPFLMLGLYLIPAVADDGAASIAAGGLVMRREPRITMAKEVLAISPEKIVVDYDFRNETAEDIATEVAFPVPPYFDDSEREPSELAFNSFRLFVEGKPVTFETELRAFVGRRDVTQILSHYRLDAATFGHSSRPGPTTDLSRLTSGQRATLVRLGILSAPGPDYPASPHWSVHIRYYWRQIFPAHRIIHIRHEYAPVTGYSQVSPDSLDAASELKEKNPAIRANLRFNRTELTSLCPSEQSLKKLAAGHDTIWTSWVDFILTTANTWKRPIEDFTLIVERIHPRDTVSFCWNGPVEQSDSNHFRAHVTNLVPARELHIGFYQQGENYVR